MLTYKEYKEQSLMESVDTKTLTKILAPVIKLVNSLGQNFQISASSLFNKRIESIVNSFIHSGSTEKSDIESFNNNVTDLLKEMKSEFLSDKSRDVSDIRVYSKENDKWRFSLMDKITEKLESITDSENIVKVKGKVITIEEKNPIQPDVEKEYILKIGDKTIGSLGYGKSEVLKSSALSKTKHTKEDYTIKKGWKASSSAHLSWAGNDVPESTKEKAIAKIL